ncbi:nucleosome-remodeling factor subunit BPTF-like isoform X2 [Nannospalax galili]|nr:nucleosome-remodeling factor subunit BPTF-like isoform X2 [Nannospalax galili]XP_029420762.1 nucleosome-remodeling factor subunit BPTF-like isoform X2 [Nannospalax galili]
MKKGSDTAQVEQVVQASVAAAPTAPVTAALAAPPAPPPPPPSASAPLPHPTTPPPAAAQKRKREGQKDAKSKKKMISTASKETKKDTKLYCICKTPYDESKFYIGCDRCQNWYHGHCVGILQSEAELIDEYVCPQCQSKKNAMTVLTPLTEKDYEGLKKILHSLQTHKLAWPFLEPVDPSVAPDYYGIIKEPMDLATMQERVQKRYYEKLTEFVADMNKIFDNCHYYNPSDSPFCQCADVLELFFVQKLKGFKVSRSLNKKRQSTASSSVCKLNPKHSKNRVV